MSIDSHEQTKDLQMSILKEIYDLMYLFALCLRRVGKLDEASNIYRKVRQLYLYEDRHRLV